MIVTGSITIYNKYIDNRAEIYQRSVIRNVNWQATKSVMGTKQGQLASNIATVFIPMTGNVEYLSPKAWQALTDKSSNWTLQEGDMIVKGEVVDELNGETGSITVSALKAKYDDVAQITSVDAMDMGSESIRHWELGCK